MFLLCLFPSRKEIERTFAKSPFLVEKNFDLFWNKLNKKEDEFDQDIEMKNENHMNSKKIKENQEIKYTNK